MKFKLFCISLCVSALALAHPTHEEIRENAIQKLYSDKDLLQYICIENRNCDLKEFTEKLEIKNVELSASSKVKTEAILVEPLKKYKQYFSAIFIKDKLKYKIVFTPDLSLSGIKILKDSHNKLYMIRSLERDSAEFWKETDYGYDPKAKQYSEIKTRCFRDIDGKASLVKCE